MSVGMMKLSAAGVSINCVAMVMLLVGIAVHASINDIDRESSEKTYAICIQKCSPQSSRDNRESLEACMLRCRNYIEEAMFRPRVTEQSSDVNSLALKNSGTRRFIRASGAKNHMFVRVGKSSDTESNIEDEEVKRSGPMQMRGSFVRIGRQMSQSPDDDNRLQAEDDTENDDDISKRRSGFVRIGRGGSLLTPAEQFVRIGRNGAVDGLDENDGDDQSNEKRAKGQAFVRIGRKSANFVRIGKAFVRIGKSDEDALSPEVDDTAKAAAEGV